MPLPDGCDSFDRIDRRTSKEKLLDLFPFFNSSLFPLFLTREPSRSPSIPPSSGPHQGRAFSLARPGPGLQGSSAVGAPRVRRSRADAVRDAQSLRHRF